MATMRAVVAEEFGEADVLQLKEWPVPEPASGEVLIEIRCAGVNFSEIMSRRFGYLGVKPPFVPGMEVSGTVLEVGAGVEHLSPGDRVCAMTLTGGYAERVAADARQTFRVPDGVDWPVASALPTIVPSGYVLLYELGRARPGDRVLVNAAAGGTGMVIGQMARHLGAQAVGVVSSAAKAEAARGYGYDEVLTTAQVEAGALETGSFDLVLDSVGGEARARGWEALAPFGMLVAYGNASGETEPPIVPAELRNGNHRAAGLSITTLATTRPELLAGVAERSFALVAEGAVRIDVSEVIPLERIADAHRDLESRRTTGKIVIDLAAAGT
jgi:NADPH:quinone reductase